MTASNSMARPIFLLLCLALLPRGRAGEPAVQEIPAAEIVRRSVEANQRDWKQLPDYDYYVHEHEGGRTRTYLSRMVLGSRYNQLIAIDEKPLSSQEAASEKERFEKELNAREHEGPTERQQRIRKYQKEIERNRFFIAQLGDAFDFVLSGTGTVAGHEVYVLTARPRRGYHPPNIQARALTGMQGTLWVDSKDFHWVKVRAEVVHAVSIEGFLARVEPGTRFELEQAPTAEGLWLPSRFMMETHAKVLFVFSHNEREEEIYSDYQKREALPE